MTFRPDRETWLDLHPKATKGQVVKQLKLQVGYSRGYQREATQARLKLRAMTKTLKGVRELLAATRCAVGRAHDEGRCLRCRLEALLA